jgi:hypothetical protein
LVKKKAKSESAAKPPWVSVPDMMKGKFHPRKAVAVGLFLLLLGVALASFGTGLYILLGWFLGLLGAGTTFVGLGLWIGLFTPEEVREYFRKVAHDLWRGTKRASKQE